MSKSIISDDVNRAYSLIREDKLSSSKKSTFFGASMNIINAAMGAGILIFPRKFATLGLMLGTISLFIAALLMTATLHIIGKAGYLCSSASYQNAVTVLLGTAAGKGTSITIGFYILGTCTSYFILIADQIETVIEYSWLRRPFIIIGAAVLVFPIMLMPDITLLEYSSTFGVLAQCYMIGCVIYHCVDGIVNDGIKPSPIVQAHWGTCLGSAFALYTFSLQCHLIFIPVVKQLRNQTQARMDGVAITGLLSCALLHAVVGVLGYLNSGALVNPDILAFNLPNSIDVKIARIAIALKCLLSYPLLHFAARTCFADLLGYDLSLGWRDPDYPRRIYVLLTLMFLGISVLIAIMVAHIDTLIDLNGALLGVFQVYFWPALMYFFYHKPPRSCVTLLVALSFVIICFAVTGFAVYDSLHKRLNEE